MNDMFCSASCLNTFSPRFQILTFQFTIYRFKFLLKTRKYHLLIFFIHLGWYNFEKLFMKVYKAIA